MEKDASAPNPCPCKKIRTAFRVLRHGSFSSQDPSPANNGESYPASGVLPVKVNPISEGERQSAIPSATLAKPHQGKEKTAQGQGLRESTAQRKHDNDDTFSDYIKRAKLTIRTLSLAPGGRNADAAGAASLADDADEHEKKKKDTKDNNFSDFISRARMKIRTSSNLGRGKSTSFKGD